MHPENEESWPTQEEVTAYLLSLPPEIQAKLAGVMELWKTEMLSPSGSEEKEILFCGADGEKIIKCLHFPAEVLDYEDGPVLLPSANKKVVIGAVSDEMVVRKVAEYNELYPDALVRERRWEMYLNGIAVEIAEMDHAQRGWDEFEALLDTTNNPQPRKYDQFPYDQDKEE
jgi:hypothetical protein